MPGAFAHITLVNQAREPARLEAGPGMLPPAALALGRWFGHCELGAVSPDYPYLAIGAHGAAAWADLMHYRHTGDMVIAGADVVRGLSGTVREKAFAWLLGYAAHVITDATIHPVVELKVGPYAENKMAHRVCEMHQDAYIYRRLNLGNVGVAEHLRSGVERCCTPDGTLEPAIADTWYTMLTRCHPNDISSNPPAIGRWHKGYTDALDTIEEGYRLMPLGRHVAVGCGLTYPLYTEVDRSSYIDSLVTPHGQLPYDAIFDKAIRHVVEGWHLIAEAVWGAGWKHPEAFGEWNLDTGRDPVGRLVLWENDEL
jgi:hypothetical protein